MSTTRPPVESAPATRPSRLEDGESPQIAITGLGLVTPLGSGLSAFTQALRGGHTAVRRSAELGKWASTAAGDPEGRAIQAAPIADFSTAGAIEPQKLRRIPRIGQLCIVAAREALGLAPGAGEADVVKRYGRQRIGVVLGTGFGSVDQVMEFNAGHLLGGPEAASPALFPTTVMNTAAALVAMELGLAGINITINHRDLSATEAVASARDQLLRGHAEAVLCGGFEELGPWLVHGYSRFDVLSPADEPMRPYDTRRTGLVLGEGAVVLLLERLGDARRRGAQVLALLRGVGRGGDDRPRIGWLRPGQEPPIAGARAAVHRALGDADLSALYVSGGGNGTELDRLETLVLRAALPRAAQGAHISSILGQTGESMMSPALRLAAGVVALTEGFLPGTVGCERPDPEHSLPGLLLRPQQGTPSSVLVPTLAQGGGAVALVLAPA